MKQPKKKPQFNFENRINELPRNAYNQLVGELVTRGYTPFRREKVLNGSIIYVEDAVLLCNFFACSVQELTDSEFSLHFAYRKKEIEKESAKKLAGLTKVA